MIYLQNVLTRKINILKGVNVMDNETQQVRETTTAAGNTVQKTTEINNPGAKSLHKQNIAERIVWYIAGILLFLLAIRFVLSLLGANTNNGFANFIYSASHPFVAPFFSLFKYDGYTYGVSRFEAYTLVAMLVYTALAFGIAKLVTITRE
jgi:hypothetical protein